MKANNHKKSTNIVNRIYSQMISFSIANSNKLLIFLFLLLLSTLPILIKLETNFGSKAWFRQKDPNLIILEKYEQDFGNDEIEIISLHLPQGLISKKNLLTIDDLTKELWLVPGVVRVDSLTNFYHSFASGDEIITEALVQIDQVKKIETTKNNLNTEPNAYLTKLTELIKSKKNLTGYLIDKKLSTAFFFLQLKRDYQEDSVALNQRLLELQKKYNEKGHSSMLFLGAASMNKAYKDTSFRDVNVFVPPLLIIILLYLFFSFKSYKAIVISFIVIFASLDFTLILCVLLGFKFNSLTFILPSIIISIGVADTVHVLNSFVNYRKLGNTLREACLYSLEKNKKPIFLTSISTAIGFFSLCFSDIQPIAQVGILAGAGTLFAMLFTYLFVPAMITTFKFDRSQKDSKSIFNINGEKVTDFLYRYKLSIIFVFLVSLTFAVLFSLKNNVNSNPYKFFKKDHWVSIVNTFFQDTLGGAAGPQIVVNSGQNEGIYQPQFLDRVDQFILELESWEGVNQVKSLLPVIKEMNQSLMQGDPKHYLINRNREAIAQEVFLFNMGLPEGMGINHFFDIPAKSLRLDVMWSFQDSKTSLGKIDEINELAKTHGLDIVVTGKSILFQRVNSYIIETLVSSMTIALIFISLLLTFIFKSIKLGLLSFIPNVTPLFFGGVGLYLIGRPVDMGSVIVASVTLGIVVDDTIHFLSNYCRYLEQGLSKREAIANTLQETGKALIITSCILVSSFSLFIFAELTTNQVFGILCTIILVLALLFDLFVLPCFLLLFDKKKEANY